MTLDADEFIRRFLLHVLPPRLHASAALRLPRQPAQGAYPAPLSGTAGPILRATPTPSKECGPVEARGHRYRPPAMSALWRQATGAAPAASPVHTRCQPRDAWGGADLRLVLSPRKLPRLPQPIP
jgi:hypothetical protein